MARSEYNHTTLRELLCNLFFDENEHPFVVIYDNKRILCDFFKQEISKHTDFKLLSIQATQNPIEFLERIKIVDDFNENQGWYQHHWIIHVFGDNARDIESFGSFHYYEKIGRVFVLEGFYDLLMLPELNLVKSRNSTSLLEKDLIVNHNIFKYIADLPISSFITSNKNFNECAAWMVLFTSNSLLNPSQKADSPVWISISQEKNIFSNEKIVLELIYLHDLINTKTLDDSITNYLNKYLNELLRELAIPNLSLSEDWSENFSRLIQYIFHYGKIAFLKRKAGKRKEITIDPFLNPPKTEVKLPQKTIEIFGNFLNEWLSNSNKILTTRVQQWTTILRKKQQSISIKDEELQGFEEIFSYMGIIDIGLASNLLKSQLKKPLNKKEWTSKVSNIIKKREQLWKKDARMWWKERYLFSFEKDSISIYDFWKFTLNAGMLLSYELSSSTWADLKEIAWEIEQIIMIVMKPQFKRIFNSEDSFKVFLEILEISNEKYYEYRNTLNVCFSKFYLNLLNSEGENTSVNLSGAIWKESIEKIKNNHKIGYVFCDGMRQDIAIELIQKIEEIWEQKKSILLEYNCEKIQITTQLPSITNIGWNQILKNDDNIFMKISGNNLISGIEKNSEKKIYNNPKDRESRILQILKESGKKIDILSIDLNTFKDQRNYLLQKNSQDDLVAVPILWYEKLDNHDFSFEDFIEKKNTFLDELQDIIWKLQRIGIKYVFVLSDHGFIFAKNEDLMNDIPSGIVHKRYCFSPNVFTEEERKKYSDWHIIKPEQLKTSIEGEGLSSIIIPINYGIFKKSRKETSFYIHGGLSYQECDLLYLKFKCILKPEVQIESIFVKDHEKIEGQEVFYLKEMGDSKYLEFLLTTRKKEDSSEHLRPITIKVICLDPRIQIDPNQELTLTSGSKRKFKLSFNKEYSINSIEIQIKNSENEIIETKKFLIHEPSIYGSKNLF